MSRRTLPFYFKPQGLSANIQKHKQSILSVTAGKKDKEMSLRNAGFLKTYTTWRDQSATLAGQHSFFTELLTLREEEQKE